MNSFYFNLGSRAAGQEKQAQALGGAKMLPWSEIGKMIWEGGKTVFGNRYARNAIPAGYNVLTDALAFSPTPSQTTPPPVTPPAPSALGWAIPAGIVGGGSLLGLGMMGRTSNPGEED